MFIETNFTGPRVNKHGNDAEQLWNTRLKGHSQQRDRAELDTTFASLKSVYLNPKSNVPVGYI